MFQKTGLLILIFYTCLFVDTQAQSDTIIVEAPAHSPKKATIYSAVLPGLGQAYNHKYWKIPIIYAALGTVGYLIYDNNGKYQTYRQAYKYRIDDDPLSVDEFSTLYTDENLKGLRDSYRRNFELSCVVAFAIYALNVIDATVDAHLYGFNVSDDLSVKVQPQFLPALSGNSSYGGIKITLKF